MRRSTWCCTPTPPRPTARTLRRFDFIIGSIHGQFRLDRAAQTERLVRAASNPFVTVIGHMTGRQLLRRSGYELDIERVLTACAAHGVAVEVNGLPGAR